MLNPETRPSLIVRLSDPQDQSAWWAFVENYEPFLKHLVGRQGVPPDHVGDVVQQVLIAVAKSVGGWQDDGGEASFRRWINRVARNVVIKFMTRQRRQCSGRGGTDAMELLDEQQQPTDPAIDRQYDHELIVWAAHRVRSEFAETSWNAFWATMIEDETVTDIAEKLSLSTGSVYMSRSRIIRRIREIVSEVMQ